jgi:hypothetical protein
VNPIQPSASDGAPDRPAADAKVEELRVGNHRLLPRGERTDRAIRPAPAQSVLIGASIVLLIAHDR